MDSTDTEAFDTVIVGAGIQGIACLKTYLRIDPRSSILALDCNKSIGGVWALENLYPILKTNNLVGTFEYSDLALLDAGLDKKYGLKEEVHVSGDASHDYLETVSKKRGLAKHIRLRSRVVRAEEQPSFTPEDSPSWKLDVVENTEDGKEITYSLSCRRLIVATGACSTPGALKLPGVADFGRPCMTFNELRHEGESLFNNPDIHHVTVWGESKSAYDAVYWAANAGKKVSWVIRKSGAGPRYMAVPFVQIGPFRKWLEGLATTRPVTWFSPCIFGAEDGFGFIRRLLHQTSAGRWLVKAFWAKLTHETIAQCGLLDEPASEKLKPLIPRTNAFYHGTQLSILNYPTKIYDFIRDGQVELLEKDVASLEPDGVVSFKDNTSIKTDAFVAITGFVFAPSISFLPASMDAELGISSLSYSPSQRDEWTRIEAVAQKEVLTQLPMLEDCAALLEASRKAGHAKDSTHEPWRLYRYIAPPSQVASGKRNLVFLSNLLSFQGHLRSDISALWSWAYFHRQLARDPIVDSPKDTLDKVKYNTALLGRWSMLRAPIGQAKNGTPDFVMDGLPYLDLLLNDLGLNVWRKNRGWFGEVFGGRLVQNDWSTEKLVSEWEERLKKLE